MRRRTAFITSAALAALITPLMATPAAAYEASSTCDALYPYDGGIYTKDAQAIGTWSWNTGTSLNDIHLQVKDGSADGHHVAIRLVTVRYNGSTHYWPWRRNYDGAGTTGSWNTSASDSGGIASAHIQGAVFEGDQALAVCSGPSRNNPN